MDIVGVLDSTDPLWRKGYIPLPMVEAEDRRCPSCRDGTGIPKAVTASRSGLEIALACNACGHAWTIEREDEPAPASMFTAEEPQEAESP